MKVDDDQAVRHVLELLKTTVPDLETLLSLLCGPLDSLRLLPPRFRKYNTSPLPDGGVTVSAHIPPLQRALLEFILPTWDTQLIASSALPLVEQYFCPDAFSFATPASGEIALLAYSTILSLPLTNHTLRLLVRLSKEYLVDKLLSVVFERTGASREVAWEDCVRNVAAVPAKVANSRAEGLLDVPEELEHAVYLNNLCVRFEDLMYSLSSTKSSKAPDKISSVAYLLTKLVNLGTMPLNPPTSRSQPSFFLTTLPAIRRRLSSETHISYSTFWSDVLAALPSTFTLQTVLTSLLSALPEPLPALDASAPQRRQAKRGGAIIRRLFGPLRPENGEMWDCVAAVALGREWRESHARTLVCWVAEADDGEGVDEKALEALLNKIVDLWSTPEHVKHSLLSRHHYMTCLLLLAFSYLPHHSPAIHTLAFSPSFVSGVGIYISHLDHSIRRCGMLVAEVVAQRAGKKLDFGDWEGEEGGKKWVRDMRRLIEGRDIDVEDVAEEFEGEEPAAKGAEDALPKVDAVSLPPPPTKSKPVVASAAAGYDSDDSLTGYASPTSSRSPSPTPSELDEIEKDPTLRVGVKKVPRPVYLAQLGAVLRGPGGLKSEPDYEEADRIQVVLDCAEELIRKKGSFGTELEENAVNLVYGFVALQDTFELDGFELKRQKAVNALVTCCPRKAAPAIIEEFFKNQYSTNQRYVMLNALALGARELASMSIPSSVVQPDTSERTTFPSKKLPPHLHQKYIAQAQGPNVVQGMLATLSRAAIDRGADASSDKVPELVRERRLRIRAPPKVTEVTAQSVVQWQQSAPAKKTTFTEVAAGYFISPLINRFWLFLRDEQTREERTAHRETLHRYRGAGSGLILNPLVLQHFLATLAILVHAAQNAPEWRSVVAPDALELAVTLGVRPVSLGDLDDEREGAADTGDRKETEASVLSTALELALVVLDGSLELDGGRSLALDHTALLMGTGEWAGQVFLRLEKGSLIEGGGGANEMRTRRAAAGVLLKAEAVQSKWGRSMVDIR